MSRLVHPAERSGAWARIVQVARYPAIWFDFRQDRDVDRTARHDLWTAGMEHAARRRRQQGRRHSRDATEVLFRLQVRQALDEQLGIGMQGVFKDATHR